MVSLLRNKWMAEILPRSHLADSVFWWFYIKEKGKTEFIQTSTYNKNYKAFEFHAHDACSFSIEINVRCQICATIIKYRQYWEDDTPLLQKFGSLAPLPFVHYYNCEGKRISLDQYNAGLLHPICHSCQRICETQELKYVSPSGCSRPLSIWEVQRIIPHLFIDDPPLGGWLFDWSDNID